MLDANARNNKIAVIQNAQDFWTDPVIRRTVLEREFTDLRAIGLEPLELDLRTFFGRAGDLERALDRFSYCWVLGGNTFVLRRAFHLSGFDMVLRELAQEDHRLIYGGYSAGSCVMAPTLDGIHLADDAGANPEGYSGPVIWEGLAQYPYSIAPHFRSDHPETKLIDRSVEYFIIKKIPFVTLRDGEAIVFETVAKQGRFIGEPL